jgi:hypothetical protein
MHLFKLLPAPNTGTVIMTVYTALFILKSGPSLIYVNTIMVEFGQIFTCFMRNCDIKIVGQNRTKSKQNFR